MTAEILYSTINTIRENIDDSNVEEIVVTLITGEKIHIRYDNIEDNNEDRFLSFCEQNLIIKNAELWYHTSFNGKAGFRAIATEHIVMIDVIYTESTADAE